MQLVSFKVVHRQEAEFPEQDEGLIVEVRCPLACRAKAGLPGRVVGEIRWPHSKWQFNVDPIRGAYRERRETTSIAEKTVRPLMSATTVVSATNVVACKELKLVSGHLLPEC